MRVAVCLSGQPRRVLQTFPSILKNIIEPNNADVFIHMNYDEDNDYIDKSHADNGICVLEKGIDKKVIELYKPIKYLVEKPKNFSKSTLTCSDKRLANFKKMNSHKNWTDEQHLQHMVKNLMSMFYSIFKANELKEIYANENGIVYDYVIRLRFDAVIQTPLVCSNYDPHFIHYAEIGQPDNLISDWINFGSNAIMNVYSSIFFNLEYINTFRFFNKDDREPNTLEPSDICGGFSEYMIRDLMYLYKIPKRGIRMNISLCYK
jgi:hypothetical protein